MKLTKAQQAEHEQAKDKLREMLKPGDTVYTILRHVSSSGMMRHISLVTKDMQDITHLAAVVLGEKIADDGGLKRGGCGMDMGFDAVYQLSRYLFPDGFTCTGKHEPGNYCPSNDHTNGDRNYEPHHHASGGYALCQRWL